MRLIGQAETVAAQIIEAFETGNVPAPLAQVFIKRNYHRPQNAWSISNQFAVMIAGCSDARGFQQWLSVNRFVRKGEKAHAWILIPLQRKFEDEKTGEETMGIYGFKTSAVFDISQTDGEPLEDAGRDAFLESLPLIQVARAWELDVYTYNGQPGSALGRYAHGRHIALGVENLSTWTHELIHAADWRAGNLKHGESKWIREIVAELGGATLLTMLGQPLAADTGGAWEYIQAYATDAKKSPIDACFKVLARTATAINLIVQAAEAHEPQA